ncbi:MULTISPECIES: hypothetical protein [Pseudomonas syringae group]|uniref:hypothetical protein n=1 Tax=Pseudomonas syringae group TaxID=136849 RepID=UPI000F00A59E|nr:MULTISPECIES: hypothetical protein [Pseudomonas syringae group]MBI6848618.1 hypothetical protein [Pseudomonas syringae]RMV04192.1 hypothetical protein ALP19_01733 [Pseudomonas syringae pv. tomato]TES52370.1 hypothetical protein E2N91_29995 [Pseudomonas syringae pv. tomato]
MQLEDELRAINLSDAAVRAFNAGQPTLGKSLEDQALALMRPANDAKADQERFEREFAIPRQMNVERDSFGVGAYISKPTQDFWDCWQTAVGTA